MEAQPFVPDVDYCAYCHGPAAGPCADCGTRCCADCVEVVMRLTTRRAVCKRCLSVATRRAQRAWRWVAGALLFAGACLLFLSRLA